ncbi:MAG: hypothetical protein LBS81_04965 [Endomicrobium sp.]|nr:hypothetical protein [Endomicrobium sp.]
MSCAKKTAIVVGYGSAGKKVTQALINQSVKPIIIEIDIDTVNILSA